MQRRISITVEPPVLDVPTHELPQKIHARPETRIKCREAPIDYNVRTTAEGAVDVVYEAIEPFFYVRAAHVTVLADQPVREPRLSGARNATNKQLHRTLEKLPVLDHGKRCTTLDLYSHSDGNARRP